MRNIINSILRHHIFGLALETLFDNLPRQLNPNMIGTEVRYSELYEGLELSVIEQRYFDGSIERFFNCKIIGIINVITISYQSGTQEDSDGIFKFGSGRKAYVNNKHNNVRYFL